MILTFRHIKVWPDQFRPAHAGRPSSPFTATYAATLDLLDRELWQLETKEAFLQVDASDRDIRLDGQLRADATVNHPGVILTIDTKAHGTLVYACDRFAGVSYRKQVGWQTNLRAIALGLEALRKVERYGIADRGQQYAGYREIGSGVPLGSGDMSVEEAAIFIGTNTDQDWGTEVRDDPAFALALYKDAAKVLHPDAGGSTASFQRLQQARAVLVAEFGEPQ